jgi:hypothetical protein
VRGKAKSHPQYPNRNTLNPLSLRERARVRGEIPPYMKM